MLGPSSAHLCALGWRAAPDDDSTRCKLVCSCMPPLQSSRFKLITIGTAVRGRVDDRCCTLVQFSRCCAENGIEIEHTCNSTVLIDMTGAV